MRVYFFIFFVICLILFLGLIQVVLLRLLNRVWWKRRLIRRLSWSLPLAGSGGILVFAFAEYHSIAWLSLPSSVLVALTVILEICLMFSLPVSGFIHSIDRVLHRWTQKRREPADTRMADPGRRLFLRGVAAAVPLVAVSTGFVGVGGSFAQANVFKKQIAIENLPDRLVGLRMLHLSDLHLSHYVTLDNLVMVLEKAEPYEPDIILMTGDIADDLGQLPDALSLVDQLGAPMGSYACLGNHEYFRGLVEVRQIFDRSPVSLLVNDGVSLTRGNSTLFVGGIDDPRFLGGVEPDFFARALDAALTKSSSEDFVLLMSHRPGVFDHAAERGVPLTLAGHTHGGQVGFLGRSLLESYLPEEYLWGYYQLMNSHLYTTCGVGHWFPFRLGCPPEAPVIELISA